MDRTTDFLVVGSGVAGLCFALKAAEKGSVLIVTKASVTDALDIESSFEISIAFNFKFDSL